MKVLFVVCLTCWHRLSYFLCNQMHKARLRSSSSTERSGRKIRSNPRLRPSQCGAIASTTYAWDFENRLTSVTLPSSGGTASFRYDPSGRRIYKSSSSGTSICAYDHDNIEETNSSGGPVARYSRGSTPTIHWRQCAPRPQAFIKQGLGSVTSLSSGAGSLAQIYSFDSFGKTTPISSLVNPFQYAGREFDSETGLYFNRSRYYDPTIWRFLAEDPSGLGSGDNLSLSTFRTLVACEPLSAVAPGP
jgi:RHS repeat-associated protein